VSLPLGPGQQLVVSLVCSLCCDQNAVRPLATPPGKLLENQEEAFHFLLPTGGRGGIWQPPLWHHEAPPCTPGHGPGHLPDSMRALNFQRPCYLRGGICLKQGTPNCEPFQGPCRAFTMCCKIKKS
uniref:Uncharacterized protein n=1 Tax=Sus scrofa TaxID=9823 RepID=A0A8D0NDK2_PIG